MLAEMLDAPVAELAMCNEVDIVDDFLNGWPLFFFNAVLEDVLNDQAASLTQSNLMPHATKSLVHLEHDLRRLATPSELEQLLPDMTCIAVNNSVWDTTE